MRYRVCFLQCYLPGQPDRGRRRRRGVSPRLGSRQHPLQIGNPFSGFLFTVRPETERDPAAHQQLLHAVEGGSRSCKRGQPVRLGPVLPNPLSP